jgi:hypothetical protein
MKFTSILVIGDRIVSETVADETNPKSLGFVMRNVLFPENRLDAKTINV